MKEVILEFRKLNARLLTLEKLVWGLLISFTISVFGAIIIALITKFF